MKKTIFISLLFLAILSLNISAQETNPSEKFGKTFNLGIGVGGYSGYYGYVGHTLPVLHIDYEFDVARNFTLAPFVSFYTYRTKHKWDNNYYYYHETVIPIGVKGTYYFDQLFKANPDWDFYLAGSAGFAIVNSSWDSGYDGDEDYYHHGNPLFLDIHAGAEYHINNHIGIFPDLSSGVSTIGLGFH